MKYKEMTQEQKQLLLKDLSARLLNEVYIENTFYSSFGEVVKVKEQLKPEHLTILYNDIYNDENWHSNSFKPYLRLMSSITKEERKELSKILNYEFYIDDDFALVAEDDRHRIRLELCEGYIDWLNAHHFDFRGLIPMGLAIEAPEGMYKNE